MNGTQAGFSCKKEVSLALWDVKTNRAKGKSEEARTLNQELDNIKAQITRHYQYICDHDSFVTAKKVYNRYAGFSEECHTLMKLFREQLESYKKKIGIEKAESTYRGLVADYKNLLLFMKSKKNTEDIVIEELGKSFIEDYYNWMLGTCALANSTAFGRVNTLKWLMYIAQEKGWIRVHPFASFECMPEYK
ncbi:MAG: phage integrase SAM-like domain-containing protein, partial [Bacteroides sp.]|nr:phage integrase SAM-like domain-containing protein [Bacteroides sp.]